jgi:hypothetical protein
LFLAVLIGCGPALAADDGKKLDAQKAAAAANLNKAGLKKLATAETADLLVLSSLPEAKAKAFADAAQKAFAAAKTALKFDAKDALWPGKLTVVVLGDNREFSSYVRVVTQQRPESKDWFTVNVRGDAPTAAVLVPNNEKPKDPEAQALVTAVVAAALLNKKAGTGPTTGSLPEWLQLGFGRLMTAKSAGGSAWTDYRAKAKQLVVGTKSKPPTIRMADLWGGTPSKDADVVAASLVEYLLYGVEGDKFFGFVTAFKPDDNRPMPSVEGAFDAVELKMDAVEPSWRYWTSKQK